MPRTLTAAARRGLLAQETGEVVVVLLTLSHPDLPGGASRFVRNTQDVVSRGQTYLASWFDVALPEERDDELGPVTLTIPNVGRMLTQAIRELADPVAITLEVVLASSPDTVEAGPFMATLRGVEYDAAAIRGRLMPRDLLDEPFPSPTMTPATLPGIF